MPGFSAGRQAEIARRLKQQALLLGFEACGISEAAELTGEARRLERWLAGGGHATMAWMENHFEKRIDPRKLVEGARTVVSVLQSYYQPEAPMPGPATGRISRYAWGEDYHVVMKEKLFLLYEWLGREVGGIEGRVFVDSAPVMDKAWAARSGLGWQGRHSNLISPRLGSYFFLGELITDAPLPPDGPAADHCGRCTRCIDACPTGALDQPYVVDAGRCISYLTIEHRGPALPIAQAEATGNWIFGCDICQEVCPWNKFAAPTREARYRPRPGLADTDLETWEELDVETFRRLFKGSAVKRARYEGFMRNVRHAAGPRRPGEAAR